MHHSETFAQVAAALAVAQGKFPTIPRDRVVTVQPRAKKKQDGTEYWPSPYSFAYAPLETILEKVRPALAENGLALLQSIVPNEAGAEFVRTLLVHSSGEWFANETPLFTSGGDNASQAYASGLTYARRYGVTALLCLAADEDDDAAGNEGGERQQAPQQQRQQGNGRQQGKPAPRQQQAASAPAEPQAKPGAQAGGEPLPLGEGPRRLLEAKAKAAGLTFEAAEAELGPFTMANLNTALAALSAKIEAGHP